MKLRELFEKDILISLADGQAGFHARIRCGGLRFRKRFFAFNQPRVPEMRSIGRFLFVSPPIETGSEPGSGKWPKHDL